MYRRRACLRKGALIETFKGVALRAHASGSHNAGVRVGTESSPAAPTLR